MVRKQEQEKLAKERAERLAVENELKAKKEAEAKVEGERIAKEEALKKAGDAEKLTDFIHNISLLRLPENLQSKDAKIAIQTVRDLLARAVEILRLAREDEADF